MSFVRVSSAKTAIRKFKSRNASCAYNKGKSMSYDYARSKKDRQAAAVKLPKRTELKGGL